MHLAPVGTWEQLAEVSALWGVKLMDSDSRNHHYKYTLLDDNGILSVKQPLLGRLRTLLKIMHLG